jgi:glycosyltransferase involved in cell wall biosynthesis
VHILRNPLEVAESLERRDGLQRTDAVLQWLRCTLDSEAATRSRNRVIISYAALLKDWRATLESLTEALQVAWPFSADEISNQVVHFLDRELRHHARTTEDVLFDPAIRDWVGEAYAAMLVLERNPASEAAGRTLDTIRREFNHAAPVLRKLQAELRAEVGQASAQSKQHAAALGEREREISTLKLSLEEAETRAAKFDAYETEAAQLTTVLEERDKELARVIATLDQKTRMAGQLTTKLGERENEVVTLKAMLRDVEARAAQLAAARAERTGADRNKAEIKQLAVALEERNREIGGLNPAVAERDQQVAELKRAIRQREAHIAALYSTRSWRLTAPLRFVSRALTGLRSGFRAALSLAAREIYRLTPLPLPIKMWIKAALFITAAPLLRRTAAYRDWAASRALTGARPANREAPPLAFHQLLIRSLFKPKLTVPYGPQDEYLIAFMSSYRKHLEERYRNNPQQKLISIVMPTFNRASCIGYAIQSVLAQSYENWELVITDDCGSDDTTDIISGFADPRIKYERLPSNLGAAGARNAALDRISGDFVTYLDSDNTMEPNFLLVLVNELEESPEFNMVYCGQRCLKIAEENTQEVFVRFGLFHRPALENGNYIDLGVVMHRRSLIAKFGKFDAKMKRLSDWEYILRCSAQTSARAIPAILSNYYVDRADNRISDVESFNEALVALDARIHDEPVSRALQGMSLPGLELMRSLSHHGPRPASCRAVSIIIPNYEAEAHLRACVQSIYAFSKGFEFELIIVDNASSSPVVSYLDELAAEGRAKVLLNKVNRGFTFAVNQGIDAAFPQNDVIILNNDAVVTRGWLGALQAVISDYPDAGVVVPRQVVLPGEETLLIHQPYREANRECDVNISAHHGNVLDPLFDAPKGYVEVSYAPFFCAYIPRSTLDLIGVLDTENGPHYRSDRLYCDLVREAAGRRIIYTPHSKIYHFVQRATDDLKKRDVALYKDMFVKNDWNAIVARRGKQSGSSR